MPIVTQTFEEKVAVLKQDTRDYIERVHPDFEEWSAHRTTIQCADVVQFLRVTSKRSFGADEIVNGMNRDVLGSGGLKLLNAGSLTYDAQQLVKRWQELPTWGQNGPELDTWE